MEIIQKSWNFIPAQKELSDQLSQRFGISEIIAQAIINRGATCVDEVRNFLYADETDLYDPFLLKDMDKAVERTLLAVRLQQKIVIYGDYDVDGITSCVILYKILKSLKANVEYYIPDRQKEGYGLNAKALENLIAAGANLLITVDCGISSFREVEDVLPKLDIIITDHHQPPASLPKAYAIINPKQKNCPYPDKNLAGVGVAFKLGQALWLSGGEEIEEDKEYKGNEAKRKFQNLGWCLELVAIGTIADIVPLIGENRILVKLGLKALKETENAGLQELITVCALSGKKIDSTAVAYILAPRLNAAGRISSANNAVSLLLSEDIGEANKLAELLNKENTVRQSIEKNIFAKAEEYIRSAGIERTKVLVLAGEDWHVGVIGIVASRLTEKYYRPAILISASGGIGKGSCRSISSFDIYAALEECSGLLSQFGGHHQAAGLTIDAENIDKFREMINDIAARKLSLDDYIPVLNIDALVPLEEINSDFMDALSCLSPHGCGNPNPVFAAENVFISDIRAIGQNFRHLKLKIKKQGSESGSGANKINNMFEVVAWNFGDFAKSLSLSEYIDLVFYPKYNDWQGNVTIQLVARDLRLKFAAPKTLPAGSATCAFPNEIYNNLDRDVLGKVYLLLKRNFCRQNLSFLVTADIIADSLYDCSKIIINPKSVGTALRIFKELNLLWYKLVSDWYHIRLLPAPAAKLSLENSPTYRQLRQANI